MLNDEIFIDSIRDLIGIDITLFLSDEEYIEGTLVDVKKDHIAVKIEGVNHYFPTDKIKGLLKNAKSSKFLIKPPKVTNLINKESFEEVLNDLLFHWVTVNSFSNRTFTGILSNITRDYLSLINGESQFFLLKSHIVNIFNGEIKNQNANKEQTNESKNEGLNNYGNTIQENLNNLNNEQVNDRTVDPEENENSADNDEQAAISTDSLEPKVLAASPDSDAAVENDIEKVASMESNPELENEQETENVELEDEIEVASTETNSNLENESEEERIESEEDPEVSSMQLFNDTKENTSDSVEEEFSNNVHFLSHMYNQESSEVGDIISKVNHFARNIRRNSSSKRKRSRRKSYTKKYNNNENGHFPVGMPVQYDSPLKLSMSKTKELEKHHVQPLQSVNQKHLNELNMVQEEHEESVQSEKMNVADNKQLLEDQYYALMNFAKKMNSTDQYPSLMKHAEKMYLQLKENRFYH